MSLKSKNVGKSYVQLQDGTNTQPQILIGNYTTRNSKKRDCQNIQGASNNQIDETSIQKDNDVQGMPLKSKNVGKFHVQLQDGTNTQPQILIDKYTLEIQKKKDCQNIQGASNNQIDEASNQKDIELQASNKIVENDFMDEEFDQDSESESPNAKKKTRGPTFMKDIWGRPSTLARNGKFCPIDVEDWHKMPMENKKKMLDVIKEKYDLPPGTESWTLRSISKKWRNWKSELKKKYYDPELPMQVLLEERDNRALVEQYVKLVIQWNSEKSKERSEKNKIARKQKIMNQTTGRRSFAQVQQKLVIYHINLIIDMH
ncbi:hypothetical protein ZIOFF_018998 [Zingiber officinale]|uniref:Uncharacterized protein n=1 Tax=Zingiber officinale TaxID=94328 RepID=A0A8J5LSI9_ZINOF|nr:hypothetical protein ZIOFF_018998 [Zingiber officinale]